MGLAFHGIGFKLPTGKKSLLGAGYIQVEVVLHGITLWKRLNGWVGID
jgi:hypothetical protein